MKKLTFLVLLISYTAFPCYGESFLINYKEPSADLVVQGKLRKVERSYHFVISIKGNRFKAKRNTIVLTGTHSDEKETILLKQIPTIRTDNPLAAATFTPKSQTLRFWYLNKRSQPRFLEINLSDNSVTPLHMRRTAKIHCQNLSHKQSLTSMRALQSLRRLPENALHVGFDLSRDAAKKLPEDRRGYIDGIFEATKSAYRSDLELSIEQDYYHEFTKKRGLGYGKLDKVEDLLRRLQLFHRISLDPSPSEHIHLFVGRKLQSNIVGAAYQGTYCQNPQFSLSLSTIQNPLKDWITLAHELGHALGARHTPQREGSIMSPIVRQENTFFSESSADEIGAHLDEFGPNCRISTANAQYGGGFAFSYINNRGKRNRRLELLFRTPQCGPDSRLIIQVSKAGKKTKWRKVGVLKNRASRQRYVFFERFQFERGKKAKMRVVRDCDRSTQEDNLVVYGEQLEGLGASRLFKLIKKALR